MALTVHMSTDRSRGTVFLGRLRTCFKGTFSMPIDLACLNALQTLLLFDLIESYQGCTGQDVSYSAKYLLTFICFLFSLSQFVGYYA